LAGFDEGKGHRGRQKTRRKERPFCGSWDRPAIDIIKTGFGEKNEEEKEPRKAATNQKKRENHPHECQEDSEYFTRMIVSDTKCGVGKMERV